MTTPDNTYVESRILEAAKQVFVRKGFSGTTMSDVAAEAGIGRTALHYYFRTKQMLFDAILGQLMGSLLPNINRIMDAEGTMLDKLPLVIKQYVTVLKQNSQLPFFFINEINRNPEHLFQAVLKDPERIAPVLKLRGQLLDEMDRGIIRQHPLEDVGVTILSLLIFPHLMRNTLSAVFLGNDDKQFDEFYARREAFVIETILGMLKLEDASK